MKRWRIVKEVCFSKIFSGRSRVGGGGGGQGTRLFWVKKEEVTEGRKAGWASTCKINQTPP